MSGKESRSNRTLECIELADKISESDEKLQCLTLLYALFANRKGIHKIIYTAQRVSKPDFSILHFYTKCCAS